MVFVAKCLKTLAKNLAFKLRAKNLSQRELAKRAGVSPAYINQLLAKTNDGPSLSRLETIASALDTTVASLFADETVGEHPLAECARRVHAHADPAYAQSPQSISVGAALDIVREELRRARSGELREELRKLGAATEDPLAPSAEGANKKVR